MKVLDIDGLNYYDGKIKQTYATKTELNAKAPLASPALTGNPTATTQTKTDNSTKLATTAFVKNNLNDYATLNGATFTGAVNGVTPTAGDDSTKLATTAYVQEELRQHASMPIGHEYFTMNPNVPQGSLPLFGGEYSRSTYADLWAWVQTQTGYCKTEAEWQTLSTSNNGNVPFYSSGNGSTTFRVPSLKCWVKGANGTVTEVGSYKAAGLPNVKGNFWHIGGKDSTTHGMISYTAEVSNLAQPATGTAIGSGHVYLDASSNSSIYGNSSTVQPESIVGMWLVKAYGTIEDTGTIDEQQYIDDRIAAEVTRTDGKFLPLVGGEMSGAIKFGTLAGKILDFGGTGHGNLSLQEENDHQVIYFSANTNGGYPPEGAQLILHSVDGDGGYGNALIRVGNDGSTCKDLRMYPNGSLTWNEWSVPIVQFGDHYTYFKDGQNGHWTIFQWGTMSLANQTSGATINDKRITFPTPFPHECQFFIGFGNWTPNERYSIHSRETTGMTFDIYNAASNPHAFEWFALGY